MKALLSARELTALAAIKAFQIEGREPSLKEIAAACGLKHKGQAARLLTGLEDKGFLHRTRSVDGAKGSTWGGLQVHQTSPALA